MHAQLIHTWCAYVCIPCERVYVSVCLQVKALLCAALAPNVAMMSEQSSPHLPPVWLTPVGVGSVTQIGQQTNTGQGTHKIRVTTHCMTPCHAGVYVCHVRHSIVSWPSQHGCGTRSCHRCVCACVCVHSVRCGPPRRSIPAPLLCSSRSADT